MTVYRGGETSTCIDKAFTWAKKDVLCFVKFEIEDFRATLLGLPI